MRKNTPPQGSSITMPADLISRLKNCGLSDAQIKKLAAAHVTDENILAQLAVDLNSFMVASGCVIGQALRVKQEFAEGEEARKSRISRMSGVELAREFVAGQVLTGPVYDRVNFLTHGYVPKVGQMTDETTLGNFLGYQIGRSKNGSERPPKYVGAQFGSVTLVSIARAFETEAAADRFDVYTGEQLDQSGFNPVHNRTFPLDNDVEMEINCFLAANLSAHDASFDPSDADHVDHAMSAAGTMAEIIEKHVRVKNETDRQQKIRADLQAQKPNSVSRKQKLALTVYLDESAKEDSDAIRLAKRRLTRPVTVTAVANFKKEPEIELPPAADLVVMYADENAGKNCRTHLFQIIRKTSYWDPSKVGAGEITTNLKVAMMSRAKVVLFLITQSFMAENYDIFEEAVRIRQSGVRVIPVIVGSCDWQSSVLGPFAPLPSSQIAISKYSKEDEAWCEVAKGVRQVVEAQIWSAPKATVQASSMSGTVVVTGNNNQVIMQQGHGSSQQASATGTNNADARRALNRFDEPTFMAIVLDNWQSAYSRFSSGMDRTQKINLLLQLVDAADIIRACARY